MRRGVVAGLVVAVCAALGLGFALGSGSAVSPSKSSVTPSKETPAASRDGSPGADASSDSAVGEREETTTARHSNSITALVVENDAGDIDVAPGPTTVVRTERWTAARQTVTESVRDGVLTIIARCPRPPVSLNQCSTRFAINAPASVRVTITVSAGDVTVLGFRGAHDLTSSAGRLTVVDGRASRVAATTSAGKVTIGLLATPTDVKATTSSGDVTVTVPAGRYAVRTQTSSGDTEVSGVQRDQAAPNRIEARTSSGDVTVHGR